ncbi:MAG TPA: DUF4215 domain-containing protein [Candidatus Eisenbacteria bacterium]|nr:DUF4215 domain-containing protein [Candidatus Eisenbacteria bacterium]
MSLRLAGFAAGLALALCAQRALAACAPVTSPNDLCGAAADPCVIDGKDCPVVAGTTLDFGTRAVVLSHSTLDVGTGTMTILAGSVELRPGSGLLGPGGAVVVHTQGTIAVLRQGNTRARIDVADPASADRIELDAGSGAIQIDGVVDARGTNADGIGGSIDLKGSNILVAGDVLGSGGNLGGGGPVSLDATAGIVMSGTIDASGGSGGTLDLEADGPITTTGRIDIRATAAGGDGGLFTVFTLDGSVTLGGKIFMQGDEGTDLEGGGSGGDLNVFSGANLTLAGDFEISGAPPDGLGGDVFFMSMLDTVQTGTIQGQGRGAESDGGNVEFEAHRTLTVGAIDVHGGADPGVEGGGVQAAAWCDVTVPSGIGINAEGAKGEIILQSGRQLTAVGTLSAGERNLLQYLELPPVTSGGTFLPELVVEQNAALTPCGGRPSASCGDGNLDPDEECDDHNTTSCDGCSSVCQIETCGNNRIDCNEQCDDGNTVSGDTCHGDCSRLDNVCGDGITDALEQCDDSNVTRCDATHCSSTCQLEACGNGRVECDEECDPPSAATGCTTECILKPPGCGNHTLDPGEECDDGNTNDGDGCSHQCRNEGCGNGKVDPGEDCDDLNTVGCDGCSPTCHFEACGNGVVDCGEECDDGARNGAPGGHCLPDVCRPGPFCSSGSTDPCIPCAATTDCDPLGACGPAACDAGVCTPIDPPVCDDNDACTGFEVCDPAVGCKSGPALDCDDGDACTDDSCDPATGCSNVPKPTVPLLMCRIAGIRSTVAGAAVTDIAPPLRTKILKALGVVESKIQLGSGSTRRAKKALKAAQKQIGKLISLVAKQRGKKITSIAADAIAQGLQGLLPPILTLQRGG